MSKIISFRLNSNNSRETKALSIFNQLRDEGHNTRHILTEGLISLDDSRETEFQLPILIELNEKLNHICRVLEQMSGDTSPVSAVCFKYSQNPELTESFIVSVKKAKKPGVTLD